MLETIKLVLKELTRNDLSRNMGNGKRLIKVCRVQTIKKVLVVVVTVLNLSITFVVPPVVW